MIPLARLDGSASLCLLIAKINWRSLPCICRTSVTWQLCGVLLLLIGATIWNHYTTHRFESLCTVLVQHLSEATFKLLQKAMKVHVPRRYQVQKEDMAKRVTALQRQLAASQSSAMQAQFAHEEFKVSWYREKTACRSEYGNAEATA